MRAAYLAVLLSLGLVLAQAPNLDTVDQLNGNSCGLDGKLKSNDTLNPERHKKLNRKKNRYDIPAVADIDDTVTLAKMIAPGDDLDRFDDSKAARIQGWVIDVKPGGIESCNCYAKANIDRDTHIEVAMSATADETDRVIVEVTPRLRMLMKQQGIDWWTTEALRHGDHAIKGKFVEFTGWLFFDEQHLEEATNTHTTGNKHVWRATCWEVHPITSIKVLDGPPANHPTFDARLMTEFRRARQMQMARNPARLNELQARNQKILKIYETENDGEEEQRRSNGN